MRKSCFFLSLEQDTKSSATRATQVSWFIHKRTTAMQIEFSLMRVSVNIISSAVILQGNEATSASFLSLKIKNLKREKIYTVYIKIFSANSHYWLYCRKAGVVPSENYPYTMLLQCTNYSDTRKQNTEIKTTFLPTPKMQACTDRGDPASN